MKREERFERHRKFVTGSLVSFELIRSRRRWRKLALLLATLLLACIVVIVVQYLKLTP